MPKGGSSTMTYPRVLTELETMRAAVAGMSIARLGDGELRIADGGNSISQLCSKELRREMVDVLNGSHGVLTCIPHMETPKYEKTWQRYNLDKYIKLYTRSEYGSAFVSRPDSAPWIDTPHYWELTEQLWRGKDIVLVISEEHSSIRPAQLSSALSMRIIEGPRRDAYERIDVLMDKIGPLEPDQVVILCLGACATVMAVRLHTRFRAHALDLGHIGRYMRKKGKYSSGNVSGSDDGVGDAQSGGAQQGEHGEVRGR